MNTTLKLGTKMHVVPIGLSREHQADALAKLFSLRLLGVIGEKKLRLVVVRNLARDSRTCASHDFCDANMVMLGTFKFVVGREPRLGGDDADGDDINLINDAWDLAKVRSFKIV